MSATLDSQRPSLPPLADGELRVLPLSHADANGLLCPAVHSPAHWMNTESFGGRQRPRVFKRNVSGNGTVKGNGGIIGGFFKTKSQTDLTAMDEMDKLRGSSFFVQKGTNILTGSHSDDIGEVVSRLEQRDSSYEKLKAALDLEITERQVICNFSRVPLLYVVINSM